MSEQFSDDGLLMTGVNQAQSTTVENILQAVSKVALQLFSSNEQG